MTGYYPVYVGVARYEDFFWVFTHLLKTISFRVGGYEMQVRQLGYGMTLGIIHASRDIAALNMSDNPIRS